MSRRAFLWLAGLAALAALTPVAANFVVGERLFEATVPRDRGPALRDRPGTGPAPTPAAGCDLDRGPCRRGGPGGIAIELEAGPRPLRSMTDLTFEVRVEGDASLAGLEGGIALTMPGMAMGANRVRLAPAGPGRWVGKGVIVRCLTGGRTWTAEVTLRPPAAASSQAGGGTPPPVATAFTFEVDR